MKKISNREEANDYYKIINKGVDEFVSKTKAMPSEVHKYLNKNKKRFLKQLELNDIDGIENVLGDVISHRKHLQDDKVVTFENFSKLNESFVELSKPSVEIEKILADKYNTSLGHIEIIDPQNHLYKINDFGKDVFCICLTHDDIVNLKLVICNKFIETIKSKVINISELVGFPMPSLKFWVSDFSSDNLLKDVISSKIDRNYIALFTFHNLQSSSSVFEFKSITKVEYFSDLTIMILS